MIKTVNNNDIFKDPETIDFFCPECESMSPTTSNRHLTTNETGELSCDAGIEISWLERVRHCTICHHEFYTSEIEVDLLEDLIKLRHFFDEVNIMMQNMVQETEDLHEATTGYLGRLKEAIKSADHFSSGIYTELNERFK